MVLRTELLRQQTKQNSWIKSFRLPVVLQCNLLYIVLNAYCPGFDIGAPTKSIFGSRKPSPEQEHGRRGKHRISHARSRSDKQNSVDPFFRKIEPLVLRFRYHQPHYPFGDAAPFLIQRVTKALRLWHGSLRVRILRFCFSADKALKAQSTG